MAVFLGSRRGFLGLIALFKRELRIARRSCHSTAICIAFDRTNIKVTALFRDKHMPDELVTARWNGIGDRLAQ